MGILPKSSGIRSEIFAMEKAPLAMKRILSVFISPIFVLIVVPSIMGSKSLWTPSLETALCETEESFVASLSI